MKYDKHTTWVLASNTNTCRIYQYKPQELTLLAEVQHPENKLKDVELTSSKPGRYKTSGPTRGTYTQRSDPKEIKIDEFAREIGKELDTARSTNAYNRLIIVAPPHMNGLLLEHMNKHVKDMVIYNFKNDVIHLSDSELSDYLHQHLA